MVRMKQESGAVWWLVVLSLVLLTGAAGAQAFPPLSVGTIETVAGNGAPAFSGDGGLATLASLKFPIGPVDRDAEGNLYIPDSSNRRIRRIDVQTGIITTIAGGGSGSSLGDGVPPTSVMLGLPTGVSVDRDGNVFFVDLSKSVVQRVDAASNLLTTVAGQGFGGFAGDGGPATEALLDNPEGIALDAAGNLFIADQVNMRVRRVDAVTGIITTIAGNGQLGFGGDGGPATDATLNFPTDVAVDAAGNVFIADVANQRIRRVDGLTGIITTVAGTGQRGFSGDGSLATSARLDFPTGVDVDETGMLFIADTSNHRIRRVDPATGIISTVAGTGAGGFSGDGGPATAAELNDPFAVTVDDSGNLWIADTDNNRIRRVFLGVPTLDVEVDVKPGSFPNSINLRSRGLVPVAILTTASFDAADVDGSSVRLGPGEAGIVHSGGHLEDVDGDGDLDLVLHFRTGEVGLGCADTEVSLVGATGDGREVAGSDSVRIVGCRSR